MNKDEALDLAEAALLWANREINGWKDDAYGYDPEDHPEIMAAIAAINQARSAPVQEPTVEENSQDWAGMDGATAWHLINRHADGWADVAKMMGEWLAANTPPAAQPAVPITESEIEKMWFQQADFPTAGQRIVGFARAIEAKLKEKNSD